VGSDWPLLTSLAGAYGGLAGAFLGPRDRFFVRMTRHGAALGAVALSSEPTLRRLRPTVPALIQGGAIAAALYGVFRVGDPVVRRLLPRGAEQIEDLYGLRTGHQALGVAARLALVIGPSEELFWRGFVQRRLSALLGEGWGALAGTAAYAGAHLATGNPVLVAAAAATGGLWGGLAARGAPMEALITSHALWDVLVFLVGPASARRPEPGRAPGVDEAVLS
jgi:membrane protease YdiL (CAAX protease family)